MRIIGFNKHTRVDDVAHAIIVNFELCTLHPRWTFTLDDMTPVSERTERLCADGLYIEAVRECVHKPPTSEAEFGQFLQVLQYCLLHVLRASPAHFPQFVETVYPAFERDENVMLLLGKTCLQETFYAEAEFFFQKILSRENSDCLIARESLRTVYEVVVPRWHFSMLNDVIRNSSYSHAISNAVSRIPNCSVLDIGSGTGLLRYGSETFRTTYLKLVYMVELVLFNYHV